MPDFLQFPSIQQFRHMLQELPYVFGTDNIPTKLQFRGSIKLHGTNASIVRHQSNEGYVDVIQSRNRIITVENDNQGCAAFLQSKDMNILFKQIQEETPSFQNHIAIYGEYCGQGIQSKVALCQLKKMFVIFAIKVDHMWVDMLQYKHVGRHEDSIFNIINFTLYEVDIDINVPKSAQDLMEKLTDDIDHECPFTKQLANISGTGEGIVWTCAENPSSRLWFKTKGKTHCTANPKTPIPSKTETFDLVKEFTNKMVTESRLQQGIQYLLEMNVPLARQSIPFFVKWITDDVVKEERDTIELNHFMIPDIQKAVSKSAGAWFKKWIDSTVPN
jgi:hypothetical protein